ncbi:MAG: CRISPR-associated protein Csx15 [Bacillota bacterium]
MRVINFSHPLTEANLRELEDLVGATVAKVSEVPSQIDPQQSLVPQLEDMLAAVDMTPREWQTLPLVVNLPSLSYSAAALLAMLHGRMGYFPPVLRLHPKPGSLPPRFVVAEVLNLQELREDARAKGR